MAIITTKSIADSKPVTPLDWTGAPMKPGQAYAGNDQAPQNAQPSPVKASPTRRKRQGIPQTPEQRKAFGDRMRAYWARKRGTTDTQSIVPAPDSPSVAPDTT